MRGRLSIEDSLPKISVILPTYNRAYCLGRTINSVINQTYINWELIIVDNYSTDNTLELVSEFNDCRIRYFRFKNDGMVAASRNEGLRYASGEHIAFLDSDDWWDSRKLEQSVIYLNEGADLIYHDLLIVSDEGVSPYFFKKSKSRKLNSPIFNDLLVNGTAISNSSVVVRRIYLNEINGFSLDPLLVGAEDYDAWLRISKITENFVKLPYCLGFYTRGRNNLSSSQRTITNLKRILSIYSADLKKIEDSIPDWMTYTFAVAYQKMGFPSQAYILFKYIVLKSSTLEYRLRALAWLLIISINFSD